MKKIVTFLFALMLIPACVQDKSDVYKTGQENTGQDKDPEKVDPPVEEECPHPFLFYTNVDFEALNAAWQKSGRTNCFQTSSALGVLFDAIKSSDVAVSDSYLDYSASQMGFDYAQKSEQVIIYNAYLYRVTGEGKYLSRAVNAMDNVCSLPDWHPAHFLDTAEAAFAVAVGMDWLYRDLPEEKISAYCDAIYKNALSLYTDPSKQFSQRQSNWNQVCNCCLAIAALAMEGEAPRNPSCETIWKACYDNLCEYSMAIYKEGAAWSEGIGYWAYGNSYVCLLLTALQDLKGKTIDSFMGAFPYFRKAPEFCYYMNSPSTGKCYNFADSGYEDTAPKLPQWWFASVLGNADHAWFERQQLKSGGSSYIGNCREKRLIPVFMPFMKDVSLVLRNPSAGGKVLWADWIGKKAQYGCPVAFMHTDMFSPTDTYAGVKGGVPFYGHAHMDVGSFIFDALGERWASDMGTVPSYSHLENAYKALGNSSLVLGDLSNGDYGNRWKVFRFTNFGHNTLSIDGCLLGIKRHAPIVSADESRQSVTLDMTDVLNPYLAAHTGHEDSGVEKASREVRLYDSALRVKDVIKLSSLKDVVLRWHMTTPAEAAVADGKSYRLTQNGKTMDLSFKLTAGGSDITQANVSLSIREPYLPVGWGPYKKSGFNMPSGSSLLTFDRSRKGKNRHWENATLWDTVELFDTYPDFSAVGFKNTDRNPVNVSLVVEVTLKKGREYVLEATLCPPGKSID